MRLTVLGSCGAWPEAGQACSGYLIEHDGFRLVVDLGYATLPRLLGLAAASEIDALFVSHGHPDHCADLNPLLRARVMGDPPAAPLPAFALSGALDAVLALDRPGMLSGGIDLREIRPGHDFEIGPFRATTRLLPHWLPDAGIRIEAGGAVLTYTGDSGPTPEIAELARGADLLLAEATHLDQVPEDAARYLSSAATAGQSAARAGVGTLLLTHLWPGTDQAASRAVARGQFDGDVGVARAGMAIEVG